MRQRLRGRSGMRPLAGRVPFRAGGFSPRDVPIAAVLTLIVLIALWQAGASAGLISTMFLPAPVAIARALWALSVSGQLWLNLGASLYRLAIGWSIGTVAGIVLGFAVGLFTLARSPGMAV